MSFQTPITIRESIEAIQSNQYVLPAIQRSFVWTPGQIERLFDSLVRGYPIGSFLFWQIAPENLGQFQFYKFMDRYHERDYRQNEPLALVGQHATIAILDGQQRLTALNIGLKGWYASKLPYYRYNSDWAYPRRRLFVNLLPSPDADGEDTYEFKMLRDTDAKQTADRFWFPVGDVFRFSDIDEVFDFCVQAGLTSTGTREPWRILSRLWRVVMSDPVINYYLERDQTLDKVLNIFIRVNSGGTPLSYSDMLLSIASAQWKDRDAREEINNLVTELNATGEEFIFGKDFVLKASLVLTDVPNIAFKVDNFNRQTMATIERRWDDITRALKLATQLIASWGYNRDTLVSHNAVIPLAYYILRRGSPADVVQSPSPGWRADRDAMRRWLMLALLKRTFSGQSDDVLRRIRRVLAQADGSFPDQAILEDLRPTTKSMAVDEAQLDGVLAYRFGQPYTFSVLALLYPWLKFDQHFHIDHIYPRSMFTERSLVSHDIPRDRWPLWLEHKDDLGNLQLLQGLVNMSKSDKDFEAWLAGTTGSPESLQAYREQHLIPDVDLAFSRFPEFLEARTQLIKGRLADLLAVQLTGVPEVAPLTELTAEQFEAITADEDYQSVGIAAPAAVSS